MFNNSPVREEPPRAAFLAGVPRLWPAPLASQNENVGLYVEGTVTGPKLKGTVKGVDYANVRADGRLQLHFHARNYDRGRQEDRVLRRCVLTPKSGSPIAQLRLSITLTTSAAEYSWVNPIQVWALGTVDFALRAAATT